MDAHWQRCIDAFLQSIEDISGSTRSRVRYAHVLRTFFSDDRNPDTYTRAQVQEYLSHKSISPRNYGADVTPSTRNNRLMALSSFYRFSATYEVNGVPLFSTEPPTHGLKYVKVISSPHALSASEIEQFFSVIDTSTIKGKRDLAIFLTYFLTAKRRSEISNLKVGDIQEMALIDEYGRLRQSHLFQYRAKGRSRIIALAELPPPAYDAIVRYWRESGRLDTLKPDSPVFASTRPDQPEQQLTGDYMNALCKQYMDLAKLNPRYTLHTWRHSSSRQRYELGSDIRAIQETLGHTSMTTTLLYLKSLTVTQDTGANLLIKRFGHLWKL